MRCNPVEPDMIARAKKNGLYVVQICITGQYMPSKDGGIAITGTFSKQAAKDLRNFTRRWYKKHGG